MQQAAITQARRQLKQYTRDLVRRSSSICLHADEGRDGMYHDSKSIPSEETTVYVRNEAYSKCTAQLKRQRRSRERRNNRHPPNRSTDVALIREPFTNKVIGDPTKARNSYKDGLFKLFFTQYAHSEKGLVRSTRTHQFLSVPWRLIP